MTARDETQSLYDGGLAAGAVIGGCVVEEPIGSGGQAVVYRATQLATGRRVAVKVLKRTLARIPSLRRRLRDEARAAAAIRHDSIVRIFDTGTADDGTPFIVMEWIDGPSLAKELKERGRLPASELLEIAQAIAGALESVHALGLVHRDVKTRNIIVRGTAPWKITLVDFGIAKISAPLRAEGARTSVSIVGTPTAMAPEQLRGGAIDQRADIYSFGTMLFELATGYKPFVATDSTELERLHLHAPRPAASSVAPVPAGLDTVLARAMAADAEHRYSSVTSLLEDLTAVLTRAVHAIPTIAIHIRSANSTAGEQAMDQAEIALQAQGFELATSTGESVLMTAPWRDTGHAHELLDIATAMAHTELTVCVHVGDLYRTGPQRSASTLVNMHMWPDCRADAPGAVALSADAAALMCRPRVSICAN